MAKRWACLVLVLVALAQFGHATEVQAETQEKGFVGDVVAGASKLIGGAAKMAGGMLSSGRSQFTGAANDISPIDVKCVLCQYFVQRIQNDIVTYSSPGVYAEFEETIKAYEGLKYSFLETESKVEATTDDAPSVSDVLANPPSMMGGVPAGVMPGRYRHSDMLGARPWTARWDPSRMTGPSMEQEQARAQYKAMYNVVFAKLQGLCQSRIPQPFLPYCASIMKDYPQIAEGLHYNDRPDVVCMNLNYCGELSYAYNAPHARFIDERESQPTLPPEAQRAA